MAQRYFQVDRDGDGKPDARMTWPAIGKLVVAGERVTVWRPKGMSVGDRIVSVARAELDRRVRETGPNTGPRVQVYQARTTVPGTGWPWCVAFTRFVLDEAGVLKGGYRGGYVPSLEAWARAAGRWVPAGPGVVPKPGWLVIFDWTRDALGDHVGIVERADGTTIEGNTQPGAGGDQSNGGGVYRRTDHTGRVVRGYVRTW